jgi:hypothetical protein
MVISHDNIRFLANVHTYFSPFHIPAFVGAGLCAPNPNIRIHYFLIAIGVACLAFLPTQVNQLYPIIFNAFECPFIGDCGQSSNQMVDSACYDLG